MSETRRRGNKMSRYGIVKNTRKWDFVQQTIMKSLPDFLPAFDKRKHKNNEAASEAVKNAASIAKFSKLKTVKSAEPKLSLQDITEVLIENIAFTAIPGGDGSFTLAIYNYDKEIYEFNTQQLSEWIADTSSVVTDRIIKDVMSTVLANRRRLVPYWDRAKFLLPVKNGILDIFNQRLIDYSIEFTVTSRVETVYESFFEAPVYADGFTFEQMLETASNGVKERKELIMQYMSYCLLGYTYDPKIMNVIGDTGSGKSTLFGLIANIIGRNQIANITYAQVDKEDILITAAGSWLIFGDDSRGKTFIKSSDFIKIKADNGYFSMSRKYLSAITLKFDMPMLELMNSHPRIDEAGQQITSRLVWLEMNKSLTKQAKANLNIREVYIKDEEFQKYVLSYFIDQFNLFDHFNSIDNSHNEAILAANDALGQFYADLYSQGCMDKCSYLPTNVLYASYLEWVKINNAGGGKYASRGFTDASAQILQEYGYQLSIDSLRAKTLEGEGKFDPDSVKFAYPDDKQLVESSMESGRPSRCYIRKVKTVPASLINMKSKTIDFIQFFKLTPQFDEFMGTSPKAKVTETKTNAIPLEDAFKLMDSGEYFEMSQDELVDKTEHNKKITETVINELEDDLDSIEMVIDDEIDSRDDEIVSDDREDEDLIDTLESIETRSDESSDSDRASKKESGKVEQLNFDSYSLDTKGFKQMYEDVVDFKEKIKELKKDRKLDVYRMKVGGDTIQSFNSLLIEMMNLHDRDHYLKSFVSDLMKNDLNEQINAMKDCVEYLYEDVYNGSEVDEFEITDDE